MYYGVFRCVTDSLHANDGKVEDAAEVLNLPESEVRLALAYYADNQSEIDDWIRANDELFEQAEAAAKRQARAARR